MFFPWNKGFLSFSKIFFVFCTFLLDCNGWVNFLLVDAVASAAKVPVLPCLLLVFEGLLYEQMKISHVVYVSI